MMCDQGGRILMKVVGIRLIFASVLTALLCFASPGTARSDGDTAADSIGRYNPRGGFQLASTEQGTVNLRLFSYLRYLNSQRLEPTYTDAFGNTTELDRRQDIHLNKVNIQIMGWIMDPKFRYLAYVWTSGTSQGQTSQVVVAGNLGYTFNPHVTVAGGVGALPGVRTTEGSFPFWLSLDNRLIADEFFRPSYTMGIWASGAVVKGLQYQVMLGNNLSQFGVDASQLDDGLNTWSASLRWYPTTGEFGYRGGFGDFDRHEKAATRLGAHYTRSDETSQGQPNTDAFENVQIRLSDGSVIFKPGLFGSGIQVREATYQMASIDAGVKYRGFSLEGEYYWRRVDRLRGPGVEGLPVEAFHDDGFQVQASTMVKPRTVQLYTGASYVSGEYGDPWDFRLGTNWYPWKHQVMWWNFEYIHTDRSPVGAASLPYLVGGTGEIFYTSFVLNF